MNTHSPLPAPGAPLQHYVSIAPLDLQSVEAMTPEQSKVFQASQLRLMWWKFQNTGLPLYPAYSWQCFISGY